ncbi:hypothetical protein FDK38_003542 [Candidozyma auris]|nr:hypothetical protein FDK38_003542 [[Candida] auris]
MDVNDAQFSARGGVNTLHGPSKILKLSWSSCEFANVLRYTNHCDKNSAPRLHAQVIYTSKILAAMKKCKSLEDEGLAQSELFMARRYTEIKTLHSRRDIGSVKPERPKVVSKIYLPGDFKHFRETVKEKPSSFFPSHFPIFQNMTLEPVTDLMLGETDELLKSEVKNEKVINIEEEKYEDFLSGDFEDFLCLWVEHSTKAPNVVKWWAQESLRPNDDSQSKQVCVNERIEKDMLEKSSPNQRSFKTFKVSPFAITSHASKLLKTSAPFKSASLVPLNTSQAKVSGKRTRLRNKFKRLGTYIYRLF